MVPGPRVELGLFCKNQILSLARLPVPPSGPSHRTIFSSMIPFQRQRNGYILDRSQTTPVAVGARIQRPARLPGTSALMPTVYAIHAKSASPFSARW